MSYKAMSAQELADHPESQHLALLHKLAGNFWHRYCLNDNRLDYEDLISIGWLALERAWRYFDRSRGYQFSTFASSTIWRSFWRAYQDQAPGPRVPPSIQLYALRDEKTHKQLRRSYTHALKVMRGHQVGMPDLPARPVEYPHQDELLLMERCLEKLPLLLRQIVCDYYYENKTLKEMGATLGFTKQRVAQLRDKALGLLSQEMRSDAQERPLE